MEVHQTARLQIMAKNKTTERSIGIWNVIFHLFLVKREKANLVSNPTTASTTYQERSVLYQVVPYLMVLFQSAVRTGRFFFMETSNNCEAESTGYSALREVQFKQTVWSLRGTYPCGIPSIWCASAFRLPKQGLC